MEAQLVSKLKEIATYWNAKEHVVQENIQKLIADDFTFVRTVHGDGNCLLYAFSYGILERAIFDEATRQKIIGLFEKLREDCKKPENNIHLPRSVCRFIDDAIDLVKCQIGVPADVLIERLNRLNTIFNSQHGRSFVAATRLLISDESMHTTDGMFDHQAAWMNNYQEYLSTMNETNEKRAKNRPPLPPLPFIQTFEEFVPWYHQRMESSKIGFFGGHFELQLLYTIFKRAFYIWPLESTFDAEIIPNAFCGDLSELETAFHLILYKEHYELIYKG